MTTGHECNICKNNWGAKRVIIHLQGVLITVYVCEVCCQGKTEEQILKEICIRRQE